MGVINNNNRLLETNVLLDRFLTYREVFTEHFKTMKVIERGEALRYETYSRLADNYISNVHRFVKLCEDYITKYNLENSQLTEKLNDYLVEVIDAISCLDTEHNLINHAKLEQDKQRIHQKEIEFMNAIGLLAN